MLGHLVAQLAIRAGVLIANERTVNDKSPDCPRRTVGFRPGLSEQRQMPLETALAA